MGCKECFEAMGKQRAVLVVTEEWQIAVAGVKQVFGTNRERGITLWTLFGTVESNQLTAKQETDTAKRSKASNNVATKRLWSNSELRLWGELLCN